MLRSLELPLIVGDGGHQRGEFPFVDTVTDSKYMASRGHVQIIEVNGHVSSQTVKSQYISVRYSGYFWLVVWNMAFMTCL